ncbi:MAG: hypothetical protein ACK4NY_19855 [Spirosomataceae bacterium]
MYNPLLRGKGGIRNQKNYTYLVYSVLNITKNYEKANHHFIAIIE